VISLSLKTLLKHVGFKVFLLNSARFLSVKVLDARSVYHALNLLTIHMFTVAVSLVCNFNDRVSEYKAEQRVGLSDLVQLAN